MTYDAAERKWPVLWKWCGRKEHPHLRNTIPEYRMRPQVRQKFKHELGCGRMASSIQREVSRSGEGDNTVYGSGSREQW